MASSTVLSRVSTRLQSLALKLNNNVTSPATSALRSRKRISGIARLPLELSSMGSMMPLHSAIASARMQSMLSVGSQSWGLIPQGISIPF